MTTNPAKPKSRRHHDPLVLRRNLNINQQIFWKPLGVTQSGGSRYEAGRRMPLPVEKLLELVYVKGVDPQQLDAHDAAILRYLKGRHPDLYATLLRATGSDE